MIKRDLASKLPLDYVLKYKILPMKEYEEVVEFACSSSHEETLLIQSLEFIFGKKVIFSLMNIEKLERVIGIYYGYDIFLEGRTDIKLSEHPTISLYHFLINNAIESNASDIHIEPKKDGVLIRYRINGSLVLANYLEEKYYKGLIQRLKALGGMNIAEKRIPQDGKLQYEYKNRNMNVRISTIPVYHGEKMVMRLLNAEEKVIDFEALAFQEHQKELILKMMCHNHGIILVTGPTGSGKSSTLYSIINRLKREDINISTVEDPVEILIEGINQTNINNKAGLTFSLGLRSLLRQDPDIIMIGEIRDEETAKTAIRAAVTGHLVLSTLHTNDVFSVLTRLQDMGIEDYLVKDALIGSISQRLIKCLCIKCREKIDKTGYYAAIGCKACNYTGYSGRIIISEALYFPEFYSLENNNGADVIRRRYREKYGNQMLANLISFYKKGVIDYKEFMLYKVECLDGDDDIHYEGT